MCFASESRKRNEDKVDNDTMTEEECSIVDEYTNTTTEALDALYTKGATIKSQICKNLPEDASSTYRLSEGGYVIDAEDEIAMITKIEYLGKWKIEYPKEEKE